MKTYTAKNKREYRFDEAVDWIQSLAVNGFYFHRALQLRMPKPPACFVFSDNKDDLTDAELALIADYHELFKTKVQMYRTELIAQINTDYVQYVKCTI